MLYKPLPLAFIIMVSDFLARATAAYLSESFISLVLASILIYYYHIYKRQFLLLWALSWAAGVINLLALCGTLWLLNTTGAIRHIVSFVATSFQSAQLILLLLGSTAIVFRKIFSQRQILFWVFLTVAISFAVTTPYFSNPDGELERYAIRVGFRYLSILAAFIAAGIIINRQQQISGTIGRKLIAISFVLFGIYQAYYLLIVAGNVTGHTFPLPFFFGIIEIVLMALIGLSMVIYLLEEEHQRMTSTNEELANFLYRTSHDLRSPVATMLSVISMTRNHPTTINSDDALHMIENRVRKLDSVINDIGEMTHKTSAEIHRQTIDFDKLMRDLIRQAQQLPGAEAVEIEYSPSSAMFSSDYQYVYNILFAFVENAVMYRDPNKPTNRVVITLQKKANRVFIEVWDNGKGIHPEVLPHIFKMFYRGNTDSDSTGLGLYVVLSMLKKLDGKVQATSVYGEHTRMNVSLSG